MRPVWCRPTETGENYEQSELRHDHPGRPDPGTSFGRHQQCSWRDGLSAGGLTYGYAPDGKKGEGVTVEHEAAIVRRIFEEYAAGRSPRDIAQRQYYA
jgi:recombinase